MNSSKDALYLKMYEKAKEIQAVTEKDPPGTFELMQMQNHRYDCECLYDEGKPIGGRIWEYGKIIFETNENSTQKELELFTKRKTDEQFDFCCFMFLECHKFWDFEKEEWVN
jgi:hypothetical protein